MSTARPREEASQQAPSCCGPDGCAVELGAGVPCRSYYVVGMTTSENVDALRVQLGPLAGGDDNLAFNLMTGRLDVYATLDTPGDAELRRAVESAGMTALPWESSAASRSPEDDVPAANWPLRLCVASGVFFLAGLVLALWDAGSLRVFLERGGGVPQPLGLPNLLYLGAIITGLWFVVPRGLKALWRLRPDINLLMTVALTGAVILGELAEAASVAFLFALSLQLESWSVRRARSAIRRALDLTPPTAWVRGDAGYQETPVEDVVPGAEVLIRPGAKVPLDGVLVRGEGLVDESALTGEPLGVPKAPGGRLYAGTLNQDGALEMRVERPASESTVARLLRQVEEARSRRARAEQLVDRFALYYTPTMIGLAAAVAVLPPLLFGGAFADWLYRALVLLVISCPCALVISTPISIFAGLACAARAGVLVRGGAFLEQASSIGVLAFDKTGTITTGQPRVTRLIPHSGVNENGLLALAASLERHSEHPIGRAIVAEAARRGLSLRTPEDFRALPGRGAQGVLEGVEHWAGNARLLEEKSPGAVPPEAAEGTTAVAAGRGDELLGWILLEDEVRPEARQAVEQLRNLGAARLVLLTGDRESAAAKVARQLGLDEYRAGLLPEDKVRALQELAAGGAKVAMVGDGMNDAPALAGAGLSISMARRGSDLAVDTADVALMSDDLRHLPWLFRHGRRTRRTIAWNIGFTLAVKAAFLTLAVLGMATLWMAVAADVGTTVLVSANALRLLR